MSKDNGKKNYQFWLSLSENVKFDDLSLELQNLGLQLILAEGEHHIFAVDESEVISLQDVQGKVTPYQIDKSLTLIERYNLGNGGQFFPDYHINIFYSEEDEGYIADIPDLAYCSAFGDTPELYFPLNIAHTINEVSPIQAQYIGRAPIGSIFSRYGSKFRAIVDVLAPFRSVFGKLASGCQKNYNFLVVDFRW